MNFDPASEDQHSEPFMFKPPADVVATFVAEASIVRAIIQGSGGPDNAEITETGLRFVRHLLANSRAIRFGFMPNLKNMEVIRECAREFIRRCGGASTALQQMYVVIQCES